MSLERGPIIYCVEEKDNAELDKIIISAQTVFTTEYLSNLLAGIEELKASDVSKSEQFRALPYYVWNNGRANKMKA